MNKLQKKREAMIERLYAEVGEEKLVVMMGMVFQARRKRAGLNEYFRLGNDQCQIKQMLDEFLQSASLRQLKMLQKMADGIIEEIVGDPTEIEKQEKAKLETITEVVKPPIKH